MSKAKLSFMSRPDYCGKYKPEIFWKHFCVALEIYTPMLLRLKTNWHGFFTLVNKVYMKCLTNVENKDTRFPRSIESFEKVLNFKIGFQDLEKVLNLAKMYMKYWICMKILMEKSEVSEQNGPWLHW